MIHNLCYNKNRKKIRMADYKIGEIVEGKVTGIQPYGAFVHLDNGQYGLVHISEISSGYVSDVGLFVQIGQTIKVKVIDTDEATHQVRLSLKAVSEPGRKNHFRQHVRKPLVMKIGFESIEKMMPVWIDEAKEGMKND